VLAAGVAGPAAAQERAPAPTDPEIAHIAVTANRIDIELAQLARTKSTNERVRAFASTMISDHESVIEQATALVTKLGVTPSENEVSRSLQAAAREARAKVEPLTGRAFDTSYMEREIAYHQGVIDAVSGVLIPNAKNGELKALLEKVLPALQAHLRMAKEVRATLGE
jgi:putative membrane protein